MEAKKRQTHLLSHLFTPPQKINLEDQSVPALGCGSETYGDGREMGDEKGVRWEKAFYVSSSARHLHC